jgi:hypothetical protein
VIAAKSRTVDQAGTTPGREPIKQEALAHVRFEARNGVKLDIATCLKSADIGSRAFTSYQTKKPPEGGFLFRQMIVDQVAIKTGSHLDIAALSDR